MTSYPQLTDYQRQAVREEMKLMQKGKETSCWYNPSKDWNKDPVTGQDIRPETIYFGERGYKPTWEEPALDMKKWMTAQSLIREGKVKESHLYDPYIGEWKDRANDFNSARHAGLGLRTAGATTTDDFSAITVLNIMAQMLGTNYITNTLTQAVTTVNTPSITLQIDTWTKFTASQDIDEGAQAPTKKGTFSRQEVVMKKDVGHVAFTDEVQLKPYPHDIYQTNIENAVADMRRIKARKIATEISTATVTSGGADWGAYTAGISTAVPFDQIGIAADTIWANTGNPNTIATADRPFRDFIGNTYVKGTTTPNPDVQFGARVINNVPGLPSFTWYIDNELAATIAIIYDKQSVVLAQGPVRTAQYRYEETGVDGYIIRDWNAVKTVQSGFIRQLQTVSA